MPALGEYLSKNANKEPHIDEVSIKARFVQYKERFDNDSRS